MAVSLLCIYPVCKGQSVGLAASPSALSAITAVSKQLPRFMLRVYAAPRFDQYILQGCHGFKTGMIHSCDGRKPVIMLIYAIWRKLPVLLLKRSPLWRVLHPRPYLNGSQIKLNASQTNSFHPSLFILMLSSLLMLVRSMLSKWIVTIYRLQPSLFFFFSPQNTMTP